MNISVKIVKTFPQVHKLKAFADLVIENSFVVHGLKVIDTARGLLVAMPSIKVGDEHLDIFHPITREAREGMANAVLSAYEEHRATQSTLTGQED
jgi:stage V sporulation protein G